MDALSVEVILGNTRKVMKDLVEQIEEWRKSGEVSGECWDVRIIVGSLACHGEIREKWSRER